MEVGAVHVSSFLPYMHTLSEAANVLTVCECLGAVTSIYSDVIIF